MGETFQDEWKPPDEFEGFTLIDVENTKWNGNLYTYTREVKLPPKGAWKGEQLTATVRLILHSFSSREVRLGGKFSVETNDGLNLTVDVDASKDFYGDYEKWPDPILGLKALKGGVSFLFETLYGQKL